MRSVVLFLFLLGSWLAPALAQSEATEDDLRRRITELRREVTVGEIEVQRLRREVERLSEDVASCRRENDELQAAAASRPSNEVETLPPIEESEVDDADLDLEPVALPPSEAEPGPEPTAPPPTPAEAGTLEPVTAEAQALYDDSYTLFHEKRYREAEDSFARFLELYPSTSLADNALFWIGECRFARGEYQEALDAFGGTVERFPEGNKVPDALFKAGRCLEALGDLVRAAETYREVLASFRGSAAAVAAAERLDDLDR